MSYLPCKQDDVVSHLTFLDSSSVRFLLSQQIDKDELDRVLTQHVTLFTPAMIQELIKEIDQDNNDTLEFPEILMILDKMGKRRQKLSNIPTSIQDNSTKVCSIQ